MPVLVGEMGPITINCLIWTGVVTRAEALAVPGRLHPERPEFGARWISYFADGVDLSQLDPDTLVALRDRFRPVIRALGAKGEFKSVLVSNSRYNDPLLAMWRLLSAMDASYASNPELANDVGAAARELGLSDAEAEQVKAWIEAQLGRTPAASR